MLEPAQRSKGIIFPPPPPTSRIQQHRPALGSPRGTSRSSAPWPVEPTESSALLVPGLSAASLTQSPSLQEALCSFSTLFLSGAEGPLGVREKAPVSSPGQCPVPGSQPRWAVLSMRAEPRLWGPSSRTPRFVCVCVDFIAVFPAAGRVGVHFAGRPLISPVPTVCFDLGGSRKESSWVCSLSYPHPTPPPHPVSREMG